MHKFYFIVLICFLYACSSEPKATEVEENTSDSIVESNQNKVDSSFIQVKNNNIDTLETNPNCSAEFLKEFNATKKYEGCENSRIKGNKIYNDKEVIAEFPDYPKKGQTVTFTGKKDKLDITLKLKRINYTSLEYNLDLLESGQITHTEKGEVRLRGGFFLGAESFINPEDQESLIFADEYITNDEKSFLTILIGDIEEVKTRYIEINNYYVAKINKKYKDNFPLLTEK